MDPKSHSTIPWCFCLTSGTVAATTAMAASTVLTPLDVGREEAEEGEDDADDGDDDGRHFLVRSLLVRTVNSVWEPLAVSIEDSLMRYRRAPF
jgi:hypothetical protein